MAYITELKPDVIFHCAAYTAVDKAEEEAKELDEKINVDGKKCSTCSKSCECSIRLYQYRLCFRWKNKM